jgi:hypothetical protein
MGITVMSHSQLMKDRADLDRIGKLLKAEKRQAHREEGLRKRAMLNNKGSTIARETQPALGTKRKKSQGPLRGDEPLVTSLGRL